MISDKFEQFFYNNIIRDIDMKLKIGDKAPNFNTTLTNNTTLSLDSLIGKWVVLYFYPKDNTPGCTNEACNFRDNMGRLTTKGVEVIGVSPDSQKSHQGFINKYNLNFLLLSDEDKAICNLYGVLGEKTMFGKKVFGVIRSTFIIDPKGIIRYIFPKVKVEGHVEEVISKLNELM
jgi:peroxiredoxin Q/BCP